MSDLVCDHPSCPCADAGEHVFGCACARNLALPTCATPGCPCASAGHHVAGCVCAKALEDEALEDEALEDECACSS